MTDERRLEALETAVRALAAEVRALRAQVDVLAPPAAPRAAPPVSAPSGRAQIRPPATSTTEGSLGPRRSAPGGGLAGEDVDVEAIVGRYGTVAVATVTVLVGVGAFLTWAIANGKLGPAARVGLGLLAAIGVAALGWRMRSRGAERYGNVMLALSLALVHLDAWGAGPHLGLVPSGVSLAVAAVCSAALAALALADDSELLFVTGVGGALLAPFVTSTETSTLFLLGYGAVVWTAGSAALADRDWRWGTRLLATACAAYTAAAFQHARLEVRAERLGPMAFALLCAGVGLLAPARGRRIPLSLAALGVAATALLWVAAALPTLPPGEAVAAAAVGALATLGVVRLVPDDVREGWRAGTVILPLGFLVAALIAVPNAVGPNGGLVAGGWGLMALAATAGTRREARWLHLMLACIATGIATGLLAADAERALPAALAAHAIAWSLALRREPAPHLLAPIGASLLVATVAAYALLAQRPAYAYAPFIGVGSANALAVVAAWSTFAWNAAPAAFGARPVAAHSRVWIRGLGGVAAFLWVREELSRAVSPEIAAFLLIGFYATAGVAAIYVGRRRAIPLLRHGGLALALYAALKALIQTFTDVGLFVASCLLVGGFLYAVGYWYRGASGPRPSRGGDPA
jgi:hypothetical protein